MESTPVRDIISGVIATETTSPTPMVKTSGLTSRPKARGGLGGAWWSQWGAGVRRWAAASEDSLWAGPNSSSTFLDSGFLAAFLKPHLCWKLWGHLVDRRGITTVRKKFPLMKRQHPPATTTDRKHNLNLKGHKGQSLWRKAENTFFKSRSHDHIFNSRKTLSPNICQELLGTLERCKHQWAETTLRTEGIKIPPQWRERLKSHRTHRCQRRRCMPMACVTQTSSFWLHFW